MSCAYLFNQIQGTVTLLIRHGLGDPDELIKVIKVSEHGRQHEELVLVVPGDIQLVYLLRQRQAADSSLLRIRTNVARVLKPNAATMRSGRLPEVLGSGCSGKQELSFNILRDRSFGDNRDFILVGSRFSRDRIRWVDTPIFRRWASRRVRDDNRIRITIFRSDSQSQDEIIAKNRLILFQKPDTRTTGRRRIRRGDLINNLRPSTSVRTKNLFLFR